MQPKLYYFFWVSLILQVFSGQVTADQNLAKQSQNPVGNIISLPVENNLYFDVGPTDKKVNALLMKPVYPVSLGKYNLINRLTVPLIYLEGQDSIGADADDESDVGDIEVFPGTDDEFGLGNVSYQGWFSPANPGKWIWGIGPVLELPTNTNNRLGTDTWSAGPSVLLLTMPGKWVVGGFAQNIWDFASDKGEPDVNKFTSQIFVNYNLDDGWYLTSAPLFTANWEADSGDEWTVPVGGGAGRLVRFGQQPVDFKLAAYYNVEKPDNGPDWNLLFSVKFLFPKK
jgi:hypothetical protein